MIYKQIFDSKVRVTVSILHPHFPHYGGSYGYTLVCLTKSALADHMWYDKVDYVGQHNVDMT